RTGQPRRGGDDVERRPSMDAPDGHYGRVERRDLAGDDRLKRLDDPRSRDDRVGRLVGGGPVAAAPFDVDREFVYRGQKRSAVDADPADRKLVPEVQTEGGG